MAQYFENDPETKSNPQLHQAIVQGNSFLFETDHGVFSKKGLDFGTRTLLETILKKSLQGTILDFGCGYGPIGIILAKSTKNPVTMIDINRRSLELAKQNARLNQVTVHIKESNFFEQVDTVYDYIVSNPPIRVGKENLYRILFEAKQYLKLQGQLWIVVHKDQGAKTVARDLEKAYQVEIVEKNKGFYIICATKIDNLQYFC